MDNRNTIQLGNNIKNFRVEKILGQGGFGITYLARDGKLDRYLAIKEYFPAEFVVRGENDSVYPRSDEDTELFEWGLERFLNEGRTLAKFKHPNIVRVIDYIEENNTAYILMEYEHGREFQSILKERKTITPDEILNTFLPLLDGLELIHNESFIHRDIKPANIFIRENNSPLLIDFGSARQRVASKTNTLTALISPGYAPFEQYGQADSDKQGPWTDIYALGACMYRALFGRSPLDAITRAEDRVSGHGDPVMKATELGKDKYPNELLEAIDYALEFLPKDRPQSISEWKQCLLSGRTATVDEIEETIKIGNTDSINTIKINIDKERKEDADKDIVNSTNNLPCDTPPVRLAVTNFLILGMLTLWAYTAYVFTERITDVLLMNNKGFTSKLKYIFSGIYISVGLFILSWIVPNVFGGFQYVESYMLPAIFVSSAIYYLNTLAFILWSTKKIKFYEKGMINIPKKVEGNAELKRANDYVLKWEIIDNNVTLFLIISLPIIFSPYFLAKVFYSGASNAIILSLPIVIMLLGGIYHVWGTRLLVNIYNQLNNMN